MRAGLPSVVFALVLVAFNPAAALKNPDQITIYVPAFEGPGELGRNVATVLNLQVYSTLRRAPWPENPEEHDFGPALIIWSRTPIDEPTHEVAAAAARVNDVLAQMVIWGKAYEYGGGVVVQANVTLPRYRDFREKTFERWRVRYRGRVFEADVPRRRFESTSLVLRKEIVDSFTLPSALRIYSARRGGAPIGAVGDEMVALQFEPDLALVRSGGVEGWIRLPNLTATRSELVEMASGVIRVFRGDFAGAISAFDRTLENPNTRTPLRIDALLYRGMAKERLAQGGREDFEAAYKFSPFSQATVRYLIMAEIAALADKPIPAEGELIRERLIKLIAEHRYLFDPNDSFLADLDAVLHP